MRQYDVIFVNQDQDTALHTVEARDIEEAKAKGYCLIAKNIKFKIMDIKECDMVLQHSPLIKIKELLC